MRRRAHAQPLGVPFVVSAGVHMGLLALAVVLSRSEPPTPLPPVYRVNMVAAPPGPRQIGVVRPPSAAPPAPSPAPVAPPPAPEQQTQRMPPPPTTQPAPPQRQPQRATPNPTATRPQASGTGEATAASTPRPAAPTAGGGPEGGRGTDVANVNTPGIDFPYPAYLNNIVRQIAVRFDPGSRASALKAQVFFIVRRDGSIANLRIHTTSGSYAFDSEAAGAVEAAAQARAFGPLPDGFREDALPVYFSFDPTIIR